MSLDRFLPRPSVVIPHTVLVCGGRDFTDWPLVERTLDGIHRRKRIDTIVHGDQRGADSLGARWGFARGLLVMAFPAKWYVNGVLDRTAGPRRNKQMLDEGKPDLVVAFPGDRGTASMVRIAKAAGVPVLEVDPNDVSDLV